MARTTDRSPNLTMSPPRASAVASAWSFTDLGVPESLVASLESRGIRSPLPIQAATIPDALAGRDICGRAPTGSGKTLAFGIPVALRTGQGVPGRPRSLVLVPTRELADQVHTEITTLLEALDGRNSHRRACPIYGGVAFGKQLKALSRGVDVIVACPGRLADLVSRGECDLGDVDLVVVDEADRMSDMGFLPEIRRLLDQCRPDRQTLLFSATLDEQVDVLVTSYQRNPVHHRADQPKETESRATHLFWGIDAGDRVALTAAVVGRAGSTVVFCRTRHGADRLARQLETAGIRSAAIHGNRSQPQRERALSAFHRGEVAALVATDVAARGIHVDGVACVIHFDVPADAKDYVHRSGRTARAGATGTVVSLVVPERRRDSAAIRRALGYDSSLATPDVASIPEAEAPQHAHKSAAKSRKSSPRKNDSHRADSNQADSPRNGDQRKKAPKKGKNPGFDKPGHQKPSSKSATHSRGTISYLDRKKGFGFVSAKNRADLFFHQSSVIGGGHRALQPGQRVEFDITRGRRGREATNIRPV